MEDEKKQLDEQLADDEAQARLDESALDEVTGAGACVPPRESFENDLFA